MINFDISSIRYDDVCRTLTEFDHIRIRWFQFAPKTVTDTDMFHHFFGRLNEDTSALPLAERGHQLFCLYLWMLRGGVGERNAKLVESLQMRPLLRL